MSSTFSTWNGPAFFSTIAMHMQICTFYVRIYAYFGVRFVSIGVDFVLSIEGTLKPCLLNGCKQGVLFLAFIRSFNYTHNICLLYVP